MKSYFVLSAFLSISVTVSQLAAAPFSLKDSDPTSPEFRKNYLGSYGINAAIEPKLEQEDRGVYELVLPFLSDNPQEAIRILAEAMKPESNAAFNFLLGSLYYMEDRLGDAERELKRSTEKHPSFRRAHRTLALVYAQRDDVPKAVEHLLKVISLGGGDGQSYGMLGYAYLRQEKYRSALGAYQNARVFAPDSYDYKRGEAQCLLSTSQYNQAIALYDELIAEDPSEAEFWLLQGNAFLALDRLEETIANLEMARTLGNESYQSLVLLANLYLRNGAIDLGADTASRSLQYADAKEARAAIDQIEYLARRGFMDQADRLAFAFEEELESKLDEKQAMAFSSARALVDFGLGRDEEGMERLKEILEEDPLNGTTLLMLGKRYAGDEMYEDAEYYYQRALSVEFFKRDALIAMGQMEVARGNFKKALSRLRKAQEMKFESNVQRFLDQVEEAWRSTQ